MDDNELTRTPRARPRRVVRGSSSARTSTAATRSRCASSATRTTPRRSPRTRSSARIGRSPGTTPQRIRELRLRAWLATIVVNLCRNRCAARAACRRRRSPRSSRRAASRPPTGRPIRAALAQAGARPRAPGGPLAALPERYRVPVVLRHVDDLSYAELAEVLGRPEGTLKSQVHRGLAHAPGRDGRHRARGADRMIRHDPPPRAAEDAAGSLAPSRPAAPRPTSRTTSSSRSGSSTGWRRSPRRSGRSGSPGTAAACPRSSRPPDGAEAAARHEARTGRRTVARRTRSRPCWPPPSAGGSRARRRVRIPLDLRGRTEFEVAVWTKALEIPRGRGPAVRLDRGGDRPAEGGPRRRDGARPQPGAAHRPVPPRRADRRHDRPVQPRRAAQQADDPRGGGPRSRRPGGCRAARRAPVRLHDDAHRLLADVPPRAPGPGPLPGVVPLAPRGPAPRATGRARSAARSPSTPPPERVPPRRPARNLA